MAAHDGPESCEFTQITHSQELPPGLREELVDCWVTVSNAGGAVIPHGFGLPPVTPAEVGPALDEIVRRLEPRRGRLLVASVAGAVAGWLLLRRDTHPLVAHCGVVHHVQTHTRFRGLGVGAALMHRASRVARDELGLEQLGLTARSGMGLEDFYAGLGWVEVGRRPGALRVGPGDDRDEILMSLTL